ncbi:MAG: 16S rRNA (guanine(527)-N(7))-methyltransferase RsmG [Cyanobacteria bacterium]|nr:16S rRNA (guanine(527)-N(7))-methyltransferase RsmG [Cyanobacteriota bacterium]
MTPVNETDPHIAFLPGPFLADCCQHSAPIDFETLSKQLQVFYGHLSTVNAHTNLIRLGDNPEETFWQRHVLDSLTLLPWLNGPEQASSLSCIDLGSGGGFPLIPLMLAMPQHEWYGVDATAKKTAFLSESIQKLMQEVGIDGRCKIVHDRIESLGQDNTYRERFDRVTARAVAPLNVLLEYAIPLLKPNGLLLAMKGLKASEEIEQARNALWVLNCVVETVQSYPPDSLLAGAVVVVIRKLGPTAKDYPRGVGIPSKSPL